MRRGRGDSPTGRFEATVISRGGPAPIGAVEARRLLKALGKRLGVRRDSVAVVFGDDAMLADLNRRFRRKSRTTDVLSFPAGDREEAHGHLGDIVISSDAARRQARRKGYTASMETSILMIHGFLHLLGYDHATDDGQMDVLERTMRLEILGAAAS